MGKFGHRHVQKEDYVRKMSHKDEDRDQGDASISQGMPKITSKPPEARRAAWNRFSLLSLRRHQPCLHLDLRFLVIRTLRHCISFKVKKFVVPCYRDPRKLIQVIEFMLEIS
jgi:hypothetical protein